MTDNRNFVTEIESQIKTRNAEIAKFRVITEVADPDDQVEYYQIIEDIVVKEDAVKEKLAAFDESGEVDRSSLKNEIEALQQRVEDAIESARIRIN